MSKNPAFKSAAAALRGSGFVVPIFLIFLAFLISSIAISAEDYMTTLGGVRLLPTRRVWEWMDMLIAALPALLTLGSGYILTALDSKMAGEVKRASNGMLDFQTLRRTVFIVWLLSICMDVATDSFYKASPNFSDPLTWGVALAESVFVFTIGSDILFLVGFGMTWELLPDVLAVVRSLPLIVQKRWQERLDEIYPERKGQRNITNQPQREQNQPRRDPNHRPRVISNGGRR